LIYSRLDDDDEVEIMRIKLVNVARNVVYGLIVVK